MDINSMANISLLGTMILMFVGASPGSTGGGIKTSTLGVLLALCRARFKGSDHICAFGRSIPEETIDRAFSVTALGVAIVIVGAAGMLLCEAGIAPIALNREHFIELLFETVSAFGTVGLSMGVTPSLSGWSKFVLIIIMFTGRLGPLVLAMAVQSSRSVHGRFFYAEEPIMIG
jgi:trk system potassium uptake protein TrkH